MASKGGKKGASQPRQSFEALLREQEEEKHSGGGSRAGKRSKTEGASSGDGGVEDEGFVPARLSQRMAMSKKGAPGDCPAVPRPPSPTPLLPLPPALGLFCAKAGRRVMQET